MIEFDTKLPCTADTLPLLLNEKSKRGVEGEGGTEALGVVADTGEEGEDTLPAVS